MMATSAARTRKVIIENAARPRLSSVILSSLLPPG
jgi:hypothetical protein